MKIKTLILLLGLLLTTSSLFAANPPTIISASTDTAVTQLTINGSGFSPSGTVPVVVLGNVTLSLVSFSDTQIVAAIPANEPAGSYSMAVTETSGGSKTTTFGVAIGAAPPVFPANALVGSASNISPTPNGNGVCLPMMGATTSLGTWGDCAASAGSFGTAPFTVSTYTTITFTISPPAPVSAVTITTFGLSIGANCTIFAGQTSCTQTFAPFAVTQDTPIGVSIHLDSGTPFRIANATWAIY